jgi:hypothetical protein
VDEQREVAEVAKVSEERRRVRERVLAVAREDDRVAGGAITGSAVVGAEDRWSDIDVSFGIADGVPLDSVLDDWTQVLAADLEVLHHWDLRRGSAIYRIFLLTNGLQLDLAVAPAAEFGARGPRFELVFGESGKGKALAQPSLDELVGMGWMSALVARSAIGRGNMWSAEYWISSLRDQTLALACLRLGEPPEYARGFDRLPRDVTVPFQDALVSSLERDELRRALVKAIELFVGEVGQLQPDLAERLGPTISRAAPDKPA